MSTWDSTPIVDAFLNLINKRDPANLLTPILGHAHAVPQQFSLPPLTAPAASMTLPNGGTIQTKPLSLPQTISMTTPSVNGCYSAGTPVTYDGPLGKLFGDTTPLTGQIVGGLGALATPVLQQLMAGSSQQDTDMGDPFLTPTRSRTSPVQVQMQPFQPADPARRPRPPIVSLLSGGRFAQV